MFSLLELYTYYKKIKMTLHINYIKKKIFICCFTNHDLKYKQKKLRVIIMNYIHTLNTHYIKY